ncbi:hydrolase [Rhodococcus sp. Eu-32]|uniref:alpha/beta fold hydrolase n=1 Tax=Rhodococcus sp. Eu-32 TaxID=1017319 RepID=UPI000DF12633|nr:alpha/beta hydrolase [Rhodococcus sp. Eu-32]RRQ27409.1 hydrolase [Rhodococcus sp. Eu-32]
MTTTAAIRWWDDDAQIAVTAGTPTHVFAAKADASPAVELALNYPTTVLSLVLADPQIDVDALADQLAAVAVPTLVIASAPDSSTDLTVPQRLSGAIDNAVFVVIDDCTHPVHTGNRESFREWTASFVTIAEGLARRAGTALAPPTPLAEGALE